MTAPPSAALQQPALTAPVHPAPLAAGTLGGGDGAPEGDQLAALYSLLEGVIQHDFLAQRRRLEADFALFSSGGAGGRGGAPSPAKRRLQARAQLGARVCAAEMSSDATRPCFAA